MTKEYLKMADGFKDGAKWFGDALREETGAADELINSAVHAINSHDELVAEVERLREFERDAMRYRFLRDNCTTQQADSHGPVFVMTIRQKDNPFNVGLSIDEAMGERKTDE